MRKSMLLLKLHNLNMLKMMMMMMMMMFCAMIN